MLVPMSDFAAKVQFYGYHNLTIAHHDVGNYSVLTGQATLQQKVSYVHS